MTGRVKSSRGASRPEWRSPSGSRRARQLPPLRKSVPISAKHDRRDDRAAAAYAEPHGATVDIADAIEAEGLIRTLARFRGADNRRGLRELAVTAVPFAILWLAAMLLVRFDIWLGLLLTIPAAAFLLRLFLIQHDCGHGSFFRRRAANQWVGRVIGVVTLTPFEFWRRSHAHHHAGTGNLDRRGLGDIDTLTLAEYRSRTRRGRWAYRMYRHPLVLFGLGPAYQSCSAIGCPPGWRAAAAGHGSAR